jgi:ribosomal protein L11 methyltransferase
MTARWWHVALSCRPEDGDLVAGAVVATTGQGVEELAPGSLSTVLSSRDAAQRLADTLAARFRGLETSVTEREPIDWTVRWRDGISTHRFGRLVITPSWLPVADAADTVVVTLDPESAFGSGEHGSTRAAMTLLERRPVHGCRVLDFGSGSGILAIAAVRLGADHAVGIEVDADALPIAEENARRNGVADRATFLLGDAAELGPLVGPAELVCANILRTANVLLLPAIRDALVPAGIAIFSGMEQAEAPLFRPVLAAAGWQLVDECQDTDWWAVAARRPS